MLAGMGATPSGTEVAETMEVRSHLELLAVGQLVEEGALDMQAGELAVLRLDLGLHHVLECGQVVDAPRGEVSGVAP